MSTTVTYQNSTLTTATNQTRILRTAGKYLDDDITVVDTTQVYLQNVILRPDAEIIQSWTLDRSLVNDDDIAIPAYSSSAIEVIAAAALTPTVTLDYANYNYYVVERFLTIPSYNTDIKEKGRPDYCASSYVYEIVAIDANTFRSIDGTLYTSRTTVIPSQVYTYAPYWSSGSALGLYTKTTYTTSQIGSTPSIASGKLTVNAPSLNMRGSSTYFTSSAWGKITDIRRQYVIEVWRAPRNNLNVDGWMGYQNMIKVAGCINGTTNKLT